MTTEDFKFDKWIEIFDMKLSPVCVNPDDLFKRQHSKIPLTDPMRQKHDMTQLKHVKDGYFLLKITTGGHKGGSSMSKSMNSDVTSP